MKDSSYINIIQQSKQLPPIKRSALIIRNTPLEPIFSDYLHYFSISSFPDFCDEKEAFFKQKKYDLTFILLDLPILIQDFYDHFYRKSEVDLQLQVQFLDDFFNRLFVHLRQICREIIFFSFLPESYSGQEEWNAFVFAVNEQVKKQTQNGCLFIDLWEMPMMYGWEKLFNLGSNWNLKNKYRPFFFEKIIRTVQKLLIPPENQIKCLVLDCDGVLWGGILSEDGIDGIHLEKEGIGRAFRLFQREILQLIQKGVIVTLCSKNNEAAVVQVFQEHPDMILKWTDIVDHQINWGNKAQNIQIMAERLNLSLEQLLFIDDSPHEISLVSKILPQMQTFLFDSDYPEQYISALHSFSFATGKGSREDSIRKRSYYQNLQRNQKKKNFSSVEEFNTYYHTEYDVRLVRTKDLNRVVQLSQRSNQFNVSVMRFSLPQLEKLLQEESYQIFCMKVKDDFGDLGLIGISSIYYDKKSACIESFIFSCRALGRNLENRFMEEIIKQINRKKVQNITAWVRKTEKNNKNVEFYRQFPIKIIENINKENEF